METTTHNITDFSLFANKDLQREGAASPEASELEAWLALGGDLRNEVARRWIARHLDAGKAPRVFVDAGFLGGGELGLALAQFTQDLLMVLPDTLTVTLLADE